MIEWLPPPSDDVDRVAIEEPLSIAVPNDVDPSRNVTVPVGVPLVCGATVAVSVTLLPYVPGEGLATTLEEVACSELEPVKLMVCGEVGALSVDVAVPVSVPVPDAGSNATLRAQTPPTATGVAAAAPRAAPTATSLTTTAARAEADPCCDDPLQPSRRC